MRPPHLRRPERGSWGPPGSPCAISRSTCRLRWSLVGRAAPCVTEPGACRVTASVLGSAEAQESSGRPGDPEEPQQKAGSARPPQAAGGTGPPRRGHRDKGMRLLLCEKELPDVAAVCQRNSLGGLSGTAPQSWHGKNSCFGCENLDENFIVVSRSEACARLSEELETGRPAAFPPRQVLLSRHSRARAAASALRHALLHFPWQFPSFSLLCSPVTAATARRASWMDSTAGPTPLSPMPPASGPEGPAYP